MKNILFVVLLVLSCLPASAQEKGGMMVVVDNYTADVMPVYLLVTRTTDTIVYRRLEGDLEARLNDLPAGVYRVTVTQNGSVRWNSSREVMVEAGMLAHVYFGNDFSIRYSSYTEDSLVTDDAWSNINVTIFTGSNFPQAANDPLKSEWGFKFAGGALVPLNGHLGLGVNMGVQYSRTAFTSDSSLVTLKGRTSEAYSYPAYVLALYLRLSSGSQYKTMQGLVFDLGVEYDAPLFFRHTATYGKTRISERYIHQFTDARVFVRLGHSLVNVFADYRPFDFLLGDFPELPRYRVGINFSFQYY